MEFLPALILFAFSSAFTPGPNNIMMMASGLNFGVRASLPHWFGIIIGVPTMFFAVGFGLGYLFETYPLLHQLIKIVGIAYLLYLAWLVANAAPAVASDRTKPLSFTQAALFQCINPKSWVIFSSAIATFTTGSADIYQQILVIGLVFFLFTIPSTGSWLLFGSLLQRIINNPRHQKIFNVTMALLLVASIAPIVYELIEQYLS